MTTRKTLSISIAIATGLLLSSCASSPSVHQNDYVYQGINFGADRNTDFKKGVQDACRTAGGDYTKDHSKFNNNASYKTGWEDGRLQCKGDSQ
jgi:hypothetical protein